jgi:hypothetical protein
VSVEPRRLTRAPIDTTGGSPPTASEFDTARRLVAESGILNPLRALVDAPTGRPRSLSVEAFLVAAQLNGLRRGHNAATSLKG